MNDKQKAIAKIKTYSNDFKVLTNLQKEAKTDEEKKKIGTAINQVVSKL